MRALLVLLLLTGLLAAAGAPDSGALLKKAESLHDAKKYVELIRLLDGTDVPKKDPNYCDLHAYLALARLVPLESPGSKEDDSFIEFPDRNGPFEDLDAVFEDPVRCRKTREKLQGQLAKTTFVESGKNGFVVTVSTDISVPLEEGGRFFLRVKDMAASKIGFTVITGRRNLLCVFPDERCTGSAGGILVFPEAGMQVKDIEIMGGFARFKIEPFDDGQVCKPFSNQEGKLELIIAHNGYDGRKEMFLEDLRESLLLFEATLGRERFQKIRFSYFEQEVSCKPIEGDPIKDAVSMRCDVDVVKQSCGQIPVVTLIRKQVKGKWIRGYTIRGQSTCFGGQPTCLRHEAAHQLFGFDDKYCCRVNMEFTNTYPTRLACEAFVEKYRRPNRDYLGYLAGFRSYATNRIATLTGLKAAYTQHPAALRVLIAGYASIEDAEKKRLAETLSCVPLPGSEGNRQAFALDQQSVMEKITTPNFSFDEILHIDKTLNPSPQPRNPKRRRLA